MSNIELFNFEESELRFVEKETTFEVVAQDLVTIFEYSETRRVLDLVDEEYQGMASFVTSSGSQEFRTVKEPGLYQFLARSNKPKCKPFQKWLYEVVLPKIRKEGGYISPTATENQLAELTNTLKTVLANQQIQLEELKEQTKLIPAFFNAGTKHKGCSNIVMSAMEYEEDVEEVYLTVLQWLQAKGVTLNTTQLNTMRKRAAQFLRLGRQKEPNKINNRVVYHSSEFCYLEQALSNVLGLD